MKKPIIFDIMKSSLKLKRGDYVTLFPGIVQLETSLYGFSNIEKL